MRIRKCASRILGSATSAYDPPPPPPPPPPTAVQFSASSSSLPAPAGEVRESQASGSADAVLLGIVCSLNRSPWDLVSPDLDYFQDFVGGDGEEQQTTISVNKIKVEGRNGPSSSSTTFVSRVAALEHSSLKKNSREKKEKKNLSVEQKPKPKTREEAIDPPRNKTYISCKKNDGKGWHCKRMAECPNTLCNYHLSQVRSYGAGGGSSTRAAASAAPPAAAAPPAGTSSAAAKGQVKNQKKKPKRSSSSSTAEGDDMFYYYYSGFGPWRSKRRSGVSSDNASRVAEVVEPNPGSDIHEREAQEKEVEVHRAEAMNNKLEEEDEEDGPVAGDDEEDNDDNVDDDRGLEWGPENKNNNGRGSEAKEEDKKNFRKRGRKPVKARSLKSLL